MTIASLFFALIATVPASPAGSGEPIMLDFTATWCGPCQQVRPAVDQLVGLGYPIKAVDIDQNQELAEKYQVTAVPTFVVINPADGRELARTSGNRPAAELASLYNQARADLHPSRKAVPRDEENADGLDEDDEADRDREHERDRERPKSSDAPNPKPWQTVVRIKVHGNGAIGFGSGTVIHSSPEESIILTCAHIFKMDDQPQLPAAQFRRRIDVELFDGILGGPERSQVRFTGESYPGVAIDYDFNRDVGLIRIKPGRRLPYARVVPPYWKPQANMKGLITVGCSEGRDATAWNTTIVNPNLHGLNGNNIYEAIECMIAPRQGRSGGGLFTSNGYLAGVCDFAEPRGNHGLYAAPSSIYNILDRNRMTAFYAPLPPGGALLASNRETREPSTPSAAKRASAPSHVRTQSPDREEGGEATLPPPGMLGIRAPQAVADGTEVRTTGAIPKRSGWHATPTARSLEPSQSPDPFDATDPIVEAPASPSPEQVEESRPIRQPSATPATRSMGGKWRPSRSALPELADPLTH